MKDAIQPTACDLVQRRQAVGVPWAALKAKCTESDSLSQSGVCLGLRTELHHQCNSIYAIT